MSGTENWRESLNDCIVHHVRDWASNKRDAWIWGIVVGWEDECLNEFKALFGWDQYTVLRLKRLREQYKGEIG